MDNLPKRALQFTKDGHTADGGILVLSGSLHISQHHFLDAVQLGETWLQTRKPPSPEGWTNNSRRPAWRNNPQHHETFLIHFRSKIKSVKKEVGGRKDSPRVDRIWSIKVECFPCTRGFSGWGENPRAASKTGMRGLGPPQVQGPCGSQVLKHWVGKRTQHGWV